MIDEENIFRMEDEKNVSAPSAPESAPAEPDAETQKPEKKKVSHGWRTFLIIWAAVLLLVGAVTCIVLYRYAAVYEVTRPELPMEEMLSSMSKDDWLDLAAPSASLYISEFEDAEALFRSYMTVP